MECTFVGTASGAPDPERSHAALYVEIEGAGILLDAGEGTARAFLRHGISTDRLGTIIVTHTHPDHISGLPMLLLAMHLEKHEAPVAIYLPADRCDWLGRLLHGMYIFEERWSFPFSIQPLPLGGLRLSGGAEITFFETNHLGKVRAVAARYGFGATSYGIILSIPGGRCVVSSDIESLADIADVIGRPCTLIIEGTHLPIASIEELARLREDLHIYVTHLPPGINGGTELPSRTSVREAEKGMTIAFDGMKIHLGS